MDYSELVKQSEKSDLDYMKWYASLPDEKKAQIHLNSHQFVAEKIAHDMKLENPFANKSDIIMRYVEHTQKDQYPDEIFSFIQQKMAQRSEAEWQKRFKIMKKKLGWSYEDMANFMGASSGNAVKASVNRQLPAFAKLAVCVFEVNELKKEMLFQNQTI